MAISEYLGLTWGHFVESSWGSTFLRQFRLSFWRYRLGAFGQSSHIYPKVVVHNPGKVRIGDRVNIAEFVHIWGGGGVAIGNDVVIASHVAITSQTHDVQAFPFRASSVMKPVAIGNNCWIGSGAKILPGVRIGENSVVAAGAVVTKDVPPNSLVAGVPARIVRRLEQGSKKS